jgi:hypothetical protein
MIFGSGDSVGISGRGSPGMIFGSGDSVGISGRGSLRPPAASRFSARKLAARSIPRRPPAYVLRAESAIKAIGSAAHGRQMALSVASQRGVTALDVRWL